MSLESDKQLVKKGDAFQTLADVENLIKTLEAHHHPLKIYRSESVGSYNKKVVRSFVWLILSCLDKVTVAKLHCSVYYILLLLFIRLKVLRTTYQVP